MGLSALPTSLDATEVGLDGGLLLGESVPELLTEGALGGSANRPKWNVRRPGLITTVCPGAGVWNSTRYPISLVMINFSLVK